MIKKTIINIILTLVFILGVRNNVYAMENEEIYLSAYELIKDVSNRDIIISDLEQISEDEYLFSLEYAGSDYGYIRIKNSDEKYVPVDFAIDEGITYKEPQFETAYSSSGSIITSDILNGLKYSSYKRLSSRSLISESYIESVTGKYACTVIALTEIAIQEGVKKNNSIADTFNALWDYTETSEYSLENGILYGSTKEKKIVSGMKEYVKNMGFSIKTTRKVSPKYEFFKNAINNNISCMLGYTIYVNNGSRIVERGHAVNVIGWYIYKDSSGNQYKYLAVANGWQNTQHYMLFEDIDFVSSYGYTFNVY